MACYLSTMTLRLPKTQFFTTALLCVASVASVALIGCGDDDNPGADDGGTDAQQGDATTDANRPGDGGLSDGSVDATADGAADAATECNFGSLPTLNVEPAHNQSFTQPVFVTQAPGDNAALWVVEKAGRIRVILDGQIEDTPFLDIRADVDAQGGNDERGMLGMAFHPQYNVNGRFFVFYTPTGNTTRVAEYKLSQENDYVADPQEVDVIFEWNDNDSRNHVGGMIAFGGDDMLYVGVGDGGGGGDNHGEFGNGLNKNTVLGKILRLDVDNAPSYAAAGNPFSGDDGHEHIWAYGVRNPWRFSFDRVGGDLFIGDVGQNRWEEISFAKAGQGGLNFGWRAYEANEVYDDDPEVMALAQNHTPPIIEVRQEQADGPLLRDSVSITGGYVYRGSAIPALQGVYLFGDFGSEDVAGIRRCGNLFSEPQRIADLSRRANGISSFGQDNAGEMYIVFYTSGVVRKIIAE